MLFKNRQQAGLLLAEKIKKRLPRFKDYLIFAIPRGGAVAGKAVSGSLSLPLFLPVVKKIGAPNNPELAIGAVGPENSVFWDRELLKELGISQKTAEKLKKIKEKERKERELKFGIKPPDLKNKKIILIDDGVATGSTVRVALDYFRKKAIREVVLAAPVIALDTLLELKDEFDKIIYLEKPKEFSAVGKFYESFPQVEDKEVLQILAKAQSPAPIP